MTSYGSNTTVQIKVFGATDSAEDTRCTNARDTATRYINTKLGLEDDITTPDNEINDCCNFLAAAIIGSSPETVIENFNWKIGLEMLKKIGMRASVQPSNNKSVVIDGFGRNEVLGNHEAVY